MSSDSANKVYVSSGVLISFTITDNPNIQPCLWETLTDKDNNINMRFIHTLYGIWRARNMAYMKTISLPLKRLLPILTISAIILTIL